MQRTQKFVDPIFLFFLFALITVAFLVISPAYQLVPHRDSGIFLFIGSQLLHGKILYLETWDHKQPLIYVLNAIGLWIGNGSVWGVWALELGFFLAALGLLYFLLRKKGNPITSFLVTTASFLTIFQIMSGNFTEEYAICIQACLLAVFFLVYLPHRSKFSGSLAATGMGVLTGLSFCIKQTYIGIGISVVIYLLFLAWLEKDKARLLHIVWMGVGFLAVNACFFVYFWSKNALPDYIFGAYQFNLIYSSQGLLERIQSFLKTGQFIGDYPLLFLMASIWLAGFFFLLIKGFPFVNNVSKRRVFQWVVLAMGLVGLVLFAFAQLRGKAAGVGLLEWIALLGGIILAAIAIILLTRKNTSTREHENGLPLRQTLAAMDWIHPGAASFFLIGLFDLPIVILTISLSGENFTHYYISLFNPLFLLIAAAILFLQKKLQNNYSKFIVNCLLIAVFFASAYSPALQIIGRLKTPGSSDSRAAAAAYLKSVTTPQDKILVWGYESVIYFLAERDSPTRFAIQVPVYYASSFQQEVLKTLLTDIQADPPSFVADTVDPAMPFIEGKTSAECLAANPLDGDGYHILLNYVCSHYEFVKSIETINIYKLKN